MVDGLRGRQTRQDRPLEGRSPEMERGHRATWSKVTHDRSHIAQSYKERHGLAPEQACLPIFTAGPGVRSDPVQYLGIPDARVSYRSEGRRSVDVGHQHRAWNMILSLDLVTRLPFGSSSIAWVCYICAGPCSRPERDGMLGMATAAVYIAHTSC
jgi:hypothetical protein